MLLFFNILYLFLYRTHVTYICFPIILLKHFLNITFSVKDFTTQLVIGYSLFITIILKRTFAQDTIINRIINSAPCLLSYFFAYYIYYPYLYMKDATFLFLTFNTM